MENHKTSKIFGRRFFGKIVASYEGEFERMDLFMYVNYI